MRKFQLATEEHTSNVELQLRLLSLESNVLSNVIDIFRNIIPSVTNKIKEISSSFFSTTTNDVSINQIRLSLADIKKKSKLVTSVDYDKHLVSVPEGFHGNMLEYVKTLEQLSPKVYSSASDLLEKYKLMLSAFITSKDAKIALADNTRIYRESLKEREHYNDRISHFFPSNQHSSKAMLGNIIHRFNDLDALAAITIKMNENHNRMNIEHINRITNETVELLSIVIDSIQNEKVVNVSPAAAKNISEGAYEIAKMIEFVSVFTFRKHQASASVANILIESTQLFNQ